jgi:hypothetical protein
MALIDDVKVNLRLSSTSFDSSEITPLIEACKKDLQLAGLHQTRILDADPLIKRAVILYCKAYFGFNNEFEKYANAYEFQKKSLACSEDYNTELVPDDE